ncbi:S-layer homology domain-containing protein [Paenibacillus sp. 2TAB23]|uniref:S-layer homology domain-containing protein n=1 Tax=Paenibacillus sp. 2TAB23 TaxID=3233004 RepID=UPI003F9837F2
MQKIKRMMVALTLTAALLTGTQGANAATAAFTDTKTHWAKSQIDSAVSQGWINGYDANTFKPNANMTRAEFLKSLVVAMKIKVADSDTPFTDDIGWFRSYISTGLKQSIIKVGDYKENNFEPNKMITREEIARMTIRALSKDPEGVKSGYLAVAKKLEIMKGYPDGSMGGTKSATRAEAVVMVLNTLKVKNTSAEVVEYPKTKEQVNALIKSLSSFNGTSMFGHDGAVVINSKGSEDFFDYTLTVEYKNAVKVTSINIADPTAANQAIVKDLLKYYYPTSFEKAYSAYLKINKSAGGNAESTIETRFDNRTFESYKGINTKRVVILIGE